MKRVLPLFLLVLVAGLSRADDLDALLAQPPSASLSVDDARHRIELLQGFLASHPERADVIEAYLIPFRRVVEPPPAPADPTPAPGPAKPRPLLLIRSSDGSARTLRAVSTQKQGSVVLAIGESGSRAVLQATTIAGEIPWFTDEELESGAVNLSATAARYETFALIVPALGGELKREAARMRAIQKARDDAARARREAADSRLAVVTAARYEAASGYSAPGLARMLLDAEAARRDLPQFAEEIDKWRAPFAEHFTKLLSGYSYADGAWVGNAELASRAREARQAKFMAGLDYQIGAEALPAGAAERFVKPMLVKAGFAALAGLAVMALGWRRRPLCLAGAVLLAGTSLATATVFFLATRDPALLETSVPAVEERQIVGALSEAAGLEESPAGPHRISDAELDSFLARHVRIAGPVDPRAARRRAIAVRFLEGRILVFQLVRSFGLDWVVRFDLSFRPGAERPEIALERTHLGALSCPEPLAADLWKNLEPQLARIVASGKVADVFTVASPGNGEIALQPRAK